MTSFVKPKLSFLLRSPPCKEHRPDALWTIRQDRPPYESFQNILHSPNRFFVLFCLKINVYSPLPFFFLFTLTIFRAQRRNFFNVYFKFLMDCCRRSARARAESADNFSIYNSLSYGLLKKKAARCVESFKLSLDIIFLNLASESPRKCV